MSLATAAATRVGEARSLTEYAKGFIGQYHIGNLILALPYRRVRERD